MYKKPFDLPPLHLIEGFEATARHLSFTMAAAELLVTALGRSPLIKRNRIEV
jgi:DNA-binding transcriptional LysR family regulator